MKNPIFEIPCRFFHLPTLYSMTQLEKLQLENDIQKWFQYSLPRKIEEKFLELITPRLETADDYILLMSRYNNGNRNPEFKSPSNGQLQWNLVGTRFLMGLLYNLIETIPTTKPETSQFNQ
jgi:hypothetical protein